MSLNLEKDLLRLQRAEDALVRSAHRHDDVLKPREYNQLRYALNLAALTTFQPGAAAKGGRTQRRDINVNEDAIANLRGQVLDKLGPPLAGDKPRPRQLVEAYLALESLWPAVQKTRAQILDHHGNDFSEAELDQEVGQKTLVSIGGGGGGAGYVYLGGYEALHQAGLIPGYIVGSSIGAVLGLFRARKRNLDLEDEIKLAKSLQWGTLFRMVSFKARYGLPGFLRLFLHAGIGKKFSSLAGDRYRLPDLEIPYEAVVAGVWKQAIGGSLDDYARKHHLDLDRPIGILDLRRRIARQLVEAVAFFNPRIAKEVVLGGDALTERFDCVDAAGFSAAIPGILHYDIARQDPHMEGILGELFKREDIACLVDGGVVNNVPVRVAWHQVRAGKIGTRNAYYLAFDCFHPQWSPRHLPLQPITRLIALQVAINRPYAHHIVNFSPTLSPVNLLPRPAQLDQAVNWGLKQVKQDLPLIKKFFEPVRWAA